MNFGVEYEPEAFSDLEGLNQIIRERIVRKINWLAINFDQITPQPLTADLSGFFKLRIGDYRAIYEFSREERVIFISRIKHRRDVYK